jgi:hypothetical protein
MTLSAMDSRVSVSFTDRAAEKTPFRRLLWIMPCAYAVQICEEWFGGFPRYIVEQMHGLPMSGLQFFINNGLFMCILLALSAWASRSAKPLSAFLLMSWASGNLFWNFVVHLLYTVTTDHYSPGLVTATLFYYPIPFIVAAAGIRDGRLARAGCVGAFAIGGTLMFGVMWGGLYHFAIWPCL